MKLCATYGLPEIVHSEQGRAFETPIVRQTLEAFGTKKTHITPYHPQGDGMVERFNRSLLQLLRERRGLGTIFASSTVCLSYCSTLIGISPFVLMFGPQPNMPLIGTPLAFVTGTYKKHLCAKFSELGPVLQDF